MTRRERLERRAERRRTWAADRERKAAAEYHRSSEAVSGLPFGQPILVGHHSEKRHRNTIERSHRAMDRAIEHSDMADHHNSKANNIEGMLNRTIFNDDHDAAERLQEKIAKLEAERERNNMINKIIRRKPKDEATPEKLAELQELTGIDCTRLFEPDFCGRIGIPAFINQNLGGNIQTARKRLQAIKARQESDE